MTRIWASLLLVVGLVSGCGPTSHRVSGDIFVTMGSGDVKRGAGLELTLVPDTPQFQAELQRQAESVGPLVRMLQEDFDQDSSAIKSERLNGMRTAWAGDENTVVKKHSTGAATTRADANGHYELTNVKPGKYVLYTSAVIFSRPISWLVPMELKAPGGAQKLDLSNHNQRP